MTRRQKEDAAFKKVWNARNMVVQRKFDAIDAFLRKRRGVHGTNVYDEIKAQWIEYAAITDRQRLILDGIIERWGL